MKNPLLWIEHDGVSFVVKHDPALADFKRDRPAMVRAITLVMIDSAIAVAKSEKERNPRLQISVAVDDRATESIQEVNRLVESLRGGGGA